MVRLTGLVLMFAVCVLHSAAIFGNAGASEQSNNELLLAKLIFAESRGNLNYSDQVGIGAVVLNRVRAAEYPKTVAAVIYQYGAFDGVTNGRISRTPDMPARAAARDAVAGFDPTGGALRYRIERGKAVFA